MKQRLLVRVLLLGAVAAMTGAGQNDQALLSGPSVGLVFDSESGELRRIEGNPGAASLSEPIARSERLALAAIVPDGRHALGVDSGTGAVVLISAGERREVPGALPGPVAIRVSRQGESAALFYAEGNVQILAGISGTPVLDWQVHLDRPLAAGIAADISSDGATLLAAEGGLLRTWRRSGERSEVDLGAGISFAAFVAGTSEIVAVTEEGRAIWMIRGGAPELLMRSADPVISAAGAADRIGLVSRGGAIAVLGGQGEMLQLHCGCRPEAMEAVNSRALFRLTGPGSGTVWMLDLGAQLPRLLFAAKGQSGSPDEVRQ